MGPKALGNEVGEDGGDPRRLSCTNPEELEKRVFGIRSPLGLRNPQALTILYCDRQRSDMNAFGHKALPGSGCPIMTREGRNSHVSGRTSYSRSESPRNNYHNYSANSSWERGLESTTVDHGATITELLLLYRSSLARC
ncbi:hypothetical protein TWF173_006701 [Orbilia oligospora]|nr:hypothetical protein TWF173_006701 [Orbilia oligospora]